MGRVIFTDLLGRVIFTHLFSGVGPVLYSKGTGLFIEWEVGEVEFTGGGELAAEHPDDQPVALDVNPEVARERVVVKCLRTEEAKTSI